MNSQTLGTAAITAALTIIGLVVVSKVYQAMQADTAPDKRSRLFDAETDMNRRMIAQTGIIQSGSAGGTI